MVHVFHSFMTDSLVPEMTLFNELSIPSASMSKVIKMIACPTFTSHMPNESLLNSGHPRDSQVRYGLSHSCMFCSFGLFIGTPAKTPMLPLIQSFRPLS